jgi:hypothetical protein
MTSLVGASSSCPRPQVQWQHLMERGQGSFGKLTYANKKPLVWVWSQALRPVVSCRPGSSRRLAVRSSLLEALSSSRQGTEVEPASSPGARASQTSASSQVDTEDDLEIHR